MAFDKENPLKYDKKLLGHITFADEDIVVFNKMNDIDFNKKVKIENFVIALCTKGRGMISINGVNHDIGVRDLVICKPNHIVEGLMESMDFECKCMLISQNMMNDILLMGNSWDAKVLIEENPVLHLEEFESDVIDAIERLIKVATIDQGLSHHKDMLECVMRAASYYFTDVLFKHIDAKPHTFYKSEVAFNKFIDILSSTYPRQRKVEFYSKKLNITNRHLASVCMRVSGKTALQLITEYSIRDIKNELLKPENTIKQVAINMGFANVSCLGRYFRNFTGMSPKKFRTTYIQKLYKS